MACGAACWRERVFLPVPQPRSINLHVSSDVLPLFVAWERNDGSSVCISRVSSAWRKFPSVS